MQTSLILFISFLALIVLAVVVTISNRNKPHSRSGVEKHPSAYKKPGIEMTTSPTGKRNGLRLRKTGTYLLLFPTMSPKGDVAYCSISLDHAGKTNHTFFLPETLLGNK